MTDRLVIFGAAGDLTSRYLIPALASLDRAGQLPEGFEILGISREDWDPARFRRHLAERLADRARDVHEATRDALLARVDYRPADVTDAPQVVAALGPLRGPIIAYLALPPAVARPTLEALAGLGLPAGSRVVAEKPFGTDLESARELNRLIYAAGRVGDREVSAYADEPGGDPSRGTETFARVTLWIDNWRWAGVPFVLCTGKSLGRDRREIHVHFRPVPHLAFQGSAPRFNVLRLQLDPDRLALAVNINGPGDPFELDCVELDARLAPQDQPAYSRLLLAVLEGDVTLSIRGDEAEESWRIVEPILDAWASGRVELLEYPAGSDGPTRPVETGPAIGPRS